MVVNADSYVVYSNLVRQTYRGLSAIYSAAVNGEIEIHAGAPDGILVGSLRTPSTGGAKAMAQTTLQRPLPPGTYDLYLVFKVGKMGDFSSFSLLKGVPGVNLVTDSDFELGVNTPWSSWMGNLEASTNYSHGGSYSLRVSNRSVGNGIAGYSLTGIVAVGTTYQATAYVTVGGGERADVMTTVQTQCGTSDSICTRVAEAQTVSRGVWKELTGSLTVPDCGVAALSEVLFYIESPLDSVDLYVDDVVITAQ